jgi:phytoene dehydrogenase-like protein
MTKSGSEHTVIIGGGHNGLVCAAYLAKAGRKVTLLEAAEQVGGAAITREFAPGFRVSAGAHLLYMLDQGISKDLSLSSHGLEMAGSDLKTVALDTGGQHLTLSADAVEGTGVSAQDQAAYQEYRRFMARFAGVIAKLHNRKPPRLGTTSRGDLFSLGKLALDIRMLGKKDMREFLRIAGINIYDVLEENFDNPQLKGALSLDGVLGAFLGPRSNNSVLTSLHRLSGGAMALPKGGMGAVTGALATAARQFGADIRTGNAVARIVMDGDRVSGVELESGERIEAATVISNADPKTTFFSLLGAQHLETGFARKVSHIRMRGNAAKLHLALDGLPEISQLSRDQLGQRLVIAPDMQYVERAFNHAKYGEYSFEPVAEITIPSLRDNSLAADGKHVLSAIVQYAPYELKQGWSDAAGAFKDQLIDLLAQYAPAIREQVQHAELLTPVDLEREFRITGGHWHHGELALDQFMMLRPVPGAAQYQSPVNGLYLCGAGCHPGGGVMGSAGRNAAEAVLGSKKS